MGLTIKTEDGVVVRPGTRVFNYYDRQAGVIGDDIDRDGWFTLTHDDGTTKTLDGSRICSIQYAMVKRWVTS
jgi:hypothetical protein